MTIAVPILLALTLLLAPIYAAQPDGPSLVPLISAEWASFLCAGTFLAALLAVFAARRGGAFAPAEKAFLILLGLALLSIPARLAVQHGAGYFGEMLRGWSILVADFALFALARRVAANPLWLYGLALAAVAGSAVAADLGVQEYIGHLRAGDPGARTFGTSTPDFLAGYFVLLLPVTLGLFLGAPGLRTTPLLRGMATLVLGVILLLQLITLLTTGSRFGLLSLGVALAVFIVSVWAAVRRGLILPQATRFLLFGLAAIFAVGGTVFARPVLGRLHTLHDNSAAFRLWTWRGSLHMALANPLLGTGVGAWTDLYPPYALAGFTRLAHQGYLQIADECGIPALVALLAALVFLGAAGVRGLCRPPDSLGGVFPPDTRLLHCGLIAALAGGIVQNLIDSDWSVFFLGAAFWTLAGLASSAEAALAQKNAPPIPVPVLAAAGSAAAALLLLTGTQGIGAGYAVAASAQKDSDPGGAAQSYGAARAWDPLNGGYAGDLGFGIYFSRMGDLLNAESALDSAVLLEPNSVNYRRLGTVLQAAHRNADAVAAYKNGLRAEPNSLDLLLRLARLSPPSDALAYYKRMSDLELSPVGTARALGESVEPNFIYADAALGDAAAASPGKAADYYRRAAQTLETYAAQGGSLNIQREAVSGGRADPQTDAALRALYDHVMTAWAQIAPADQKWGLRAREKEFAGKFDALLREESQDAAKAGML